MSIIRNEIPILEYDSDPNAVFMPNHKHLDLKLPRRAVYAFLGDQVDKYALEHTWQQVSTFRTATKDYPIYVGEHQGKQMALCQAPVGSAPAAQLLDWLISYGATDIISAGSCGALTELPEGAFLVPCRALRDEGTSYHYLPPSRYAEVNARARRAIKETLAAHHLPYQECVTWSTDGFYRETQEKVIYRREEGCQVVDMECSALAACAQLRGVTWGQILFTADSLANVKKYDYRNLGDRSSFGYALQLCLDAVLRL